VRGDALAKVVPMKTHLGLAVAAALSLGSLAPAWIGQDSTAKDAQRAAARPVTVIAIRHAEKAHDGTRDPALTEEGQERAEVLARLLGHAEVTHVFSTRYRRTEATVAPLAKRLKLEVLRYDPTAMEELVERLRGLPGGSVALVSGHSNTTPGLVLALGGAIPELGSVRGAPALDESEYDRMFLVTLPVLAEGAASCVELRYGE
jgi:phosphohistidine phosphatase SixA